MLNPCAHIWARNHDPITMQPYAICINCCIIETEYSAQLDLILRHFNIPSNILSRLSHYNPVLSNV